MFFQVPDGMYQILIEGKRSVSPKISGIAIDDVLVTACSTFGKGWHSTEITIAIGDLLLLVTLQYSDHKYRHSA